MANVWNEARGVWEDTATGNYMKPQDRGGDGLWYSANGQSVYNESTSQWYNKASGAVVNTGPTTTRNATTPQTNAYTPNAGYGMDVLNVQNAQQSKITSANNTSAETQTRMQTDTSRANALTQAATAKEVAEIQTRHTREIAELDSATEKEIARMNADLQRELEAKRITSAEYLAGKQLAQQEAEFARNLAFQELSQRQNHEIQQAQVGIATAAETRQERELQANLAANPQDWVAYEFYKRQLPGAQAGQRIAGGEMLGGGNYESAPGPMADSQAQTLATNLFNPQQAGAVYNPNLRGTGVFGTSIEAPNTLTRGEVSGMSEGELGMLQGLLRAGIQMPGGHRVAVDAQDYFSQVEKSWIPKYSDVSTTPVTYR